MFYFDYYDSPLGKMILESDGEKLCGLCFAGQKYSENKPEDCYVVGLPVFETTKKWLDAYFKGSALTPEPEIKLCGTPFRLIVWDLLKKIPYGSTVSYGELAKIVAEKTGKAKMSAQAIGNAVSRNPVAIIIPCHRVVGTDGSMTGYAGGISKKEFLLNLESKAFLP